MWLIKVAIIHDWLVSRRGGEQVLEKLCRLYPQAEIFTLFYRPGTVGKEIESRPIHVSSLNSLPGVHRYYRYLLPFLPTAIEQFDLNGFDLVISSSHCVAKGVIPAPSAVHVSYCHTPMRYVWDRRADYFGTGLKSKLLSPFLHRLRNWDTLSSARVDHFIANSYWVQKRIEKYYRRSSVVVSPPVDTDFFRPGETEPERNYYLVAGAMAPYKRVDLAMAACTSLDRPLWIAGGGQEQEALRKLAGPNVRFLGNVSRTELRHLYRNAKALLFPGEEDFGIAPVEAMACGTPVIALARGGLTETVKENASGIFFSEQNVRSLERAILAFEAKEPLFTQETCRAPALRYSEMAFLENLSSFLEKCLKGIKKAERNLDAPL